MTTYNDYYPETLSLLTDIVAAGGTITHVDDGGDENIAVTTIEQAAEAVVAVEEASVHGTISGRHFWVYLVLGNEPGVIAADYTANIPELEAAISANADKWEGKPQPTKEVP